MNLVTAGNEQGGPQINAEWTCILGCPRSTPGDKSLSARSVFVKYRKQGGWGRSGKGFREGKAA